MGNLMRSFESHFIIRRSRQAACLAALSERELDEVAAESSADVREELSLCFEEEGWKLEFNDAGDIVEVRFVGDTLDQFDVFERAAQFVEAGSFVRFRQEYAEGVPGRPNTEWNFDGETMEWKTLGAVPMSKRSSSG